MNEIVVKVLTFVSILDQGVIGQNYVCHPNPCQHGGLCILQGTNRQAYTCFCQSGYSGTNCTVEPGATLATTTKSPTLFVNDACHPSPCENGGICIKKPYRNLGYTCFCQSWYTGVNCTDVCHPSQCENGGICIKKPNRNLGYTCYCQSWFSGVNCTEEYPCHRNPCLHGGICVPRLNGLHRHTCFCQSGYSGLNCEVYPTKATSKSVQTYTSAAKPSKAPTTESLSTRLSSAVRSTKPTSPTSSPITTPALGSECDKYAIINMIARESTSFSLLSPECPSGSYTAPEALVVSMCASIGSPSRWRRGSNVMNMCKTNQTAPLYTPIGTFRHNGYNPIYDWAAIFLGCEAGGFKLAIQMCDGSPLIRHARVGHNGFHADPYEYYWIVN